MDDTVEYVMANFSRTMWSFGAWDERNLRYFLGVVSDLLYKDVGKLPDELSDDERTAIRVAQQLMAWAAKEPEEVRVVKAKPSITFGSITLGGHPKE